MVGGVTIRDHALPTEYLTVREVAAILRCHRSTVRRHIRAGRLPALKATTGGSTLLIPRQAVQDLLNGNAPG